MKKRFSETQIIGFLREAEAGVPVKQVCRQHWFSEASPPTNRSDERQRWKAVTSVEIVAIEDTHG